MSGKPRVELIENEAPPASARILADANRIEHETDKRGRSIGVRRLEFIDIHKLTKAAGGETALNSMALGQILGACSVVEIDGDIVPRPGTELQIEALMTRLGNDGIAAASKALERLNATLDDNKGEIKN